MTNKFKNKKATITFIFLVSLSVIAVFAFVKLNNGGYFHKTKELLFGGIAKKNEVNTSFTFEVPEGAVQARSFVIYDLTHGRVVAASKAQELLPLASISKLMTAFVAVSDCRDDLKSKLDELLIESSNEDADYIAANCPNTEDFIKSMNQYVKKYDLKMKFINPSGLDINGETEASNFGDAISVARLINIFYRKDSAAMEKTTHNKVGEFTNTNEYADILPFLSGSKTGFTDVAGGNLVTMFDILDNRIAIVVLGSTKEARFQDTAILLKSYFLNYK